MAPSRRVTRKWELFAGRNKFYCDGFLLTAPNSSIFYLTVFLITGTSGLFFGFDCPFLAVRITPAIPVIGIALYIFTMCSLLRTSFSDPGIIPRASQDEAAYIEKQIEVPNSLNSPTYRPPPRTKEIFVRGQTVKLKYCFTCKIFRPPRASHCSLCDNCVDRFDHHCPWVGNCVGRRNYRFFYMFIVSLAFLAVFIFACAVTHMVLLKGDEDDLFAVISKTPFSLVVSIICFLSVWSVIGLAGFHTYLTTSDQTTNEDIKGSFSAKGVTQSANPYSHGNICLNCFFILCGPLQPSLIDRRGIVTDEYRLQMQPPDKFGPLAPPLVVHQPISSNIDPMIKPYSNVDIDGQNMSHLSGVYRQRSYDNLQNDKSNSVQHLVENELPVGQGPSTTVEIRTVPKEDPESSPKSADSPSVTIQDAQVSKNNLNGSYNNLFRESSTLSNLSNLSHMSQNGDGLTDDKRLQMTYGVRAVVEPKPNENVYSNIPNKPDHVYSNIEEEASKSQVPKSQKVPYREEDLSVSAILNSSFMSDLDLDDPLDCSFIKEKQPSSPRNLNGALEGSVRNGGAPSSRNTIYSNKLKALPSISSSSSTTGTQITSIELKNVLNVVLTNKSNNKSNQATNSTTSLNSLKSPSPVNATQVSTLSSSKLRLLQDSAIDTSFMKNDLDLDDPLTCFSSNTATASSLDGSNNSQSCLVSNKTAIV